MRRLASVLLELSVRDMLPGPPDLKAQASGLIRLSFFFAVKRSRDDRKMTVPAVQIQVIVALNDIRGHRFDRPDSPGLPRPCRTHSSMRGGRSFPQAHCAYTRECAGSSTA